ncbi:ankyrin repeat domain-containing protein [Chitinibacter sp. S2-10]|uniref:ankyrin repeat domain-containing protein n=1 Tax=Chitinibacter sp. S2-10 TaxID=3373597 RepID=UPI003977324A
MHLLAMQISALRRPELIPHTLIQHYPWLADEIARRWGDLDLTEYLLSLLVQDETRSSPVMHAAHWNDVVGELMRLSIAYVEIVDKIAETRDVWSNERMVDDSIEFSGYFIRGDAVVLSGSYTMAGYDAGLNTVWPRPTEPKEWSPLMQAAFSGSQVKVELLLEAGADLNETDERACQAIHLAALQGHAKVLACLLGQGADVNAVSDDLGTPLIMAASRGHLAAIDVLLDCHANVNQARRDGCTALHRAIAKGHDAIAVRLLQAGANPRLPNQQGQSACDLLPHDKPRLHELMEQAVPWQAMQSQNRREIVFQPLIDWS